MFSKECKAHLKDAGMGRWEHFWFAMGVAWDLKKAAIALVIHAFAPRFFKTYASDKIFELAAKTAKVRNAHDD